MARCLDIAERLYTILLLGSEPHSTLGKLFNKILQTNPETDFRNVILLVLQHVKWMECRERTGISLVKAHEKFLQAVDPLADGFHRLDSGTIDRPTMIELHNDAKQAKAELKAAYDLFWAGCPSPKAGPHVRGIRVLVFNNLPHTY